MRARRRPKVRSITTGGNLVYLHYAELCRVTVVIERRKLKIKSPAAGIQDFVAWIAINCKDWPSSGSANSIGPVPRSPEFSNRQNCEPLYYEGRFVPKAGHKYQVLILRMPF